MSDGFTRERAKALLEQWTASASLVKHGLSVSCCTEAYGVLEAERLGLSGAPFDAFVDKYAIAGLLHDFDYDRHPSLEEHPYVGVKFLREQGWPEEILHAILAHADYTGAGRDSHLDKALFACDELSGFLTACALVKPSKSIMDVEVAGVRKKMKDKAFARAVLREDITGGAELLGIPVEDHIGNCLRAMQAKAAELGLAGVPI
ncbi:Predicted hydrolase, HD superfamily [Granulicella pectinivorans]|uniref:Predicted hydrolase, HD superfamily n=1 Tax=Granulicella pectinivorans TaxID=474950 RepID=A0A1I6MCP9_9BACT|nr:HD domain-containing protein [Granulicella pectinivorans]SFS13383.1 Predicted hydrolase, HD superfamily [Granulicella pectinivorans]